MDLFPRERETLGLPGSVQETVALAEPAHHLALVGLLRVIVERLSWVERDEQFTKIF